MRSVVSNQSNASAFGFIFNYLCCLDGIPASFGDLINLTSLLLQKNGLTGKWLESQRLEYLSSFSPAAAVAAVQHLNHAYS